MERVSKAKFELAEPLPDEEVGYWRVSTGRDQDPDFQIALLKKRGIPEENIFGDIMSGAKARRPGLELALKLMAGRPGWTLVFWKLDRLGRDTFELMRLSKEFEAERWNIVSMTEGIDTRTPMGRAFYGMLAVFAQFERDSTRERTIAGMARRKELGIVMGRKTKLSLAQFQQAERMLLSGKHTIKAVGAKFKVSASAVNFHFPSWQSKTKIERARWRKLHPFPSQK